MSHNEPYYQTERKGRSKYITDQSSMSQHLSD